MNASTDGTGRRGGGHFAGIATWRIANWRNARQDRSMTMHRGTWLVTGLLALATLSAGGVVVQQSPSHDGAARRREEFQLLVQGLGFGASVDLAQCECGFDPRLRPACSQQDGVVPGGFFLCSRHAGCVLRRPGLAPSGISEADLNDHAAFR